MAKLIVSLAAIFFAAMTVFTSGAEACISCEYVPSVAKSPAKSSNASRDKRKSVNRSTYQRKTRGVTKRASKRKSSTKKRIVEREASAKKRIVNRKTSPKKVETAKSAPIKLESDKQNSTSSRASLGNSYVGCKAVSVGCVVANARPSKKNFGRLINVTKRSEFASGPRDSKTMTRGVIGTPEQ
jgi:hypothetical protein